MRYPATLLLLVFLSAANDVFAVSPQTHIWDKTPIKITLSVDKEKRLEFPEGIAQVNVKGSINKVSNIMTVPGDERIYWTANEAFEQSRVIVVTVTGYHYYLDVNATKSGGSARPLIIKNQQAAKPGGSTAKLPSYDYVDLVRYAAQHFHGPARLITPLYGVSRMAQPNLALPNLFRGNLVQARPVIQWRSRNPERYITAVEVRNITNRPVELLPTMIRGDFLFAAPHNPTLKPSGVLGDTCLFYLISDLPFKRAANLYAEHAHGNQ